MTRDKVQCTLDDAYGCKVTHAIIRPEMCLCGDEVGGNICITGYGHVGGELFLAARERNHPTKQNFQNQQKVQFDWSHFFHR